jgi:hypothetical protein
MTMSEVGRRDQLVDPVNGGDVAADGTLLSVAEIQQRFREERARRGLAAPARPTVDRVVDRGTAPTPTGTATAVLDPPPGEPGRVIAREPVAPAVPGPISADAPSGRRPAAAAPVGASCEQAPTAPAPATATGKLDLPASWVRVLAGHSGAGASTVALAIADAAAGAGRPSQLIETAPASRSGLVSAASRELDIDATGAWRRGARPHPTTAVHVTVDRRTEDQPPAAWPTTESASGPDDRLVTVDLGFASGEALGRAAGGPIVIACRATIPGVRLTEQMLNRLTEATVVVAVLGGHRWPGEVTASCGPRLSALRAAGRVVTVPLDGHLAITGPTHVPLPKAVVAAGRDVLGLLDSAHEGAASPTAHRALRPRRKGTPR